MKKIVSLITLIMGAFIFSANAQDIIVLTNGNEIKAKVQEVTTTDVRYKLFDSPEGATLFVPKSEVFSITYDDGYRIVIDQSTAKKTNAPIEKGTRAIGVYIPVLANYGLGAKYQQIVSDAIRLDGTFSIFTFFDNDFSGWDINANVHYLVPVEQFVIYPLLGLGIRNIKERDAGKETRPVLNAGGGIDIMLSEKATFNLELKISNVSMLSFGFMFKL